MPEKLGMLQLLDDNVGSRGGRRLWLLQCECGEKLVAIARDVRRGHTASCGCLRNRPHAQTHGHSRKKDGKQSREYNSWLNMRVRCDKTSYHSFHVYGGRGIRYCERWQTFENFIADMGACPKGASLDRIDSDGNYEPSNCRWASKKVQGENKRSTRWLSHGGETMSIADWARRIGVNHETLRKRINAGMPLERALKRRINE